MKLNVQQIEPYIEQLNRLDAKKKELDALRPLDSRVLAHIKEGLDFEWTYNSNRIEGNSLSLRETRMILEEGVTIKGKSLREHFEAVNHSEAIELVEELVGADQAILEKNVLSVHALVLQKIDREFAGVYRNGGVRIVGANFTPPNALRVYDLMQELLSWVNENPQDLHPLILATLFHHRFVWIHPFFDGNGRTIRLISNLLIMNHGFPPAIILSSDRKKYYRALNMANNGDYSKLMLIVLQATERSLDIYLSNAKNYADQYKPISQIVEEEESPYGAEYVSLLARKGQIEAYKEGKVWYTTFDAIKVYASKHGK